MRILGRWSVTSCVNFCVQFLWAGVLVILCLLALSIVFQFFGMSFVFIDLPISFSATLLPSDLTIGAKESVILFSDHFTTSYRPALFEDGDRWRFAVLTLLQITGLAIILYGLSQLKAILRNLMRQNPFAKDNGPRLQIIAIVTMLFTPFFYGYHWVSYWFFVTSVDAPSHLQAVVPDFDIIYIILGLIILILSEIFRQATKIHKEQKLTV